MAMRINDLIVKQWKVISENNVTNNPKPGSTDPISAKWANNHMLQWHSSSNQIGTPGELGFGVGIFPSELPFGFSELPNTHDKTSENYGNYLYLDGSVMCWIPAFYYRIGNSLNKTHSTYGLNSIDIVPVSAFINRQSASQQGFALHRAFINKGLERPGFFVDKFQCSNNNGVASSIKHRDPLTVRSNNNPITQLNNNPVGNNSGCVTAAKSRGELFHCMSRFQWSALALLSLAHAQYSTTANINAWHDPTGSKNYPKGNNNSNLSDVDDVFVTWQSSDVYPELGKTGSGGNAATSTNNFAKTTHNGQTCGVSDLNGNLSEVTIGMTCLAVVKLISNITQANPCVVTINNHGLYHNDIIMMSDAGGMSQLNNRLFKIFILDNNNIILDNVDSTAMSPYSTGGVILSGKFYAAKESVDMSQLTNGTTTVNDHWSTVGVTTNFTEVSVNFNTQYNSNISAQCFGNGSFQVFNPQSAGNAWLLTGLGLPASNGFSTTGINLFGRDQYIQWIRNRMCVLSGGAWNGSHASGIWATSLNGFNTETVNTVGFRTAAYI